MVIQGCKQVSAGTAAPNGTMPTGMTKIGKVYKDSFEIVQDKPDKNQHYEEGQLFAVATIFEGKTIGIKFELIADAVSILELIGGETTAGAWGINESKQFEKAIKVETEQGMDITIPNGVGVATLIGKLTKKDLLRVAVEMDPQAVSAGKAFNIIPKVE